MIYEPNEDSYLLAEFVRKYAHGKVLDMGTGSGIQAKTALENTKNVLAADINTEAVKFCKKKGIKAIKSDLFKNIHEKFDLIIFNPPYLPLERDYASIRMTEKDFTYVNDISIVGGKKGHETIERFLKEAKKYLKNNGKILLSFSNISGNIKEIIKNHNYKFKKVGERKIFFETLYVYILKAKSL